MEINHSLYWETDSLTVKSGSSAQTSEETRSFLLPLRKPFNHFLTFLNKISKKSSDPVLHPTTETETASGQN